MARIDLTTSSQLPTARAMRGALRLGARVASIGALLVVWELLARSGLLTAYQLPPFSTVLADWATMVEGGNRFNADNLPVAYSTKTS